MGTSSPIFADNYQPGRPSLRCLRMWNCARQRKVAIPERSLNRQSAKSIGTVASMTPIPYRRAIQSDDTNSPTTIAATAIGIRAPKKNPQKRATPIAVVSTSASCMMHCCTTGSFSSESCSKNIRSFECSTEGRSHALLPSLYLSLLLVVQQRFVSRGVEDDDIPLEMLLQHLCGQPLIITAVICAVVPEMYLLFFPVQIQ